MHDLRSQKPCWTRMCLLQLSQGIECTFKSEKLCCGSFINCHMGRMEISSVLRMKRGNGNFKKKFFFIFKLLFKNPEKKSSLCVLKAQSPTTHLYMLTQTFLHFPSGCDLVILSAFWGEWVYHFCYRTVLSPHQTSMRYLFITTHPSTPIYNVK